MGAGASHIAVGKELIRLLVVKVLRGLLNELAIVVEFLEKVACCVAVHIAGSATVDIERDAQPRHRIFDNLMIAVNNILWGNTLFLSLDGDGHTMLVAAANHNHIIALEAQITCIDIGRHIHACKVADVHRTVGVRQSRGHQCALEILLHN